MSSCACDLRLLLLALCLPALAAAADPEPAPAEPLPKVLSLHQALERFRTHSFDLLVAEAAVESARGDLAIAGAVPNPGLSGSVGKSYQLETGAQLPGSAFGPPAFSAGLSDNNALEQLLSGKVGLRRDVARAALAAAQGQRAEAQRTLTFQLEQQFLQALQAQEALKLDQENAQTWWKFLSLTDKRYRLGAISEADLARVETAKLESDQAVDTARQNLEQAKAGLAFLLGVRGPVPDFDLDDSQFTRYAVPHSFENPSPGKLIQQALERRPDVLATRAQVQRARAALSLARRDVLPDVGLNVGYTVQGTSPAVTQVTPPTYSVGLSTTLPILYFQQGEVRKAAADLVTQQALEQKAEAQVVSDVRSAYAAFVGAGQLAQRMEEGGLLAESTRARDLVMIQYEKGAASLLDYLNAQQTAIATQLEYRQDLASYWTAVFQLAQATALEVP